MLKEKYQRFLFGIAEVILPFIIWLFGKTWRITIEGADNEKVDGGFLYAFWHGRMLPFAYSHRHKGILVLISEHQDGEVIARAIKTLGFGAVRGSTTRGGRKALRNMVKRLTNNEIIAITPDGPRGPRYVVQQGIAYVSAKAKVPIIPASNSAKDKIHLTSWDKFMIPLPFTRVRILIGEPIYPRDLSSEGINELGKELQNRLRELTDRADRSFLN
ncbi:lysophospholipid acyltransferase family protein [bacterium]|nr:lysophospholipid acyltransferase family protein [bacterium]